MNITFLIGFLGQDAELKELDGGSKVASFSMAVSESWKPKDSEEFKSRTDWFRVVAWNKLAEFVSAYKKGDLVLVRGKLRERKWEDDEGNKRSMIEIEARSIQKVVKHTKKSEEPEYNEEEDLPF